MHNNWQVQFSRDASLLAHVLDVPTDQLLLSHLSEADYRNASFLDQRIITPQLQRILVPWSEVSKLPLGDASGPHYIFHIGHVGSTLISRLLGEIDTILALREPQLLRTLAEISQLQGSPESPWSPEQYENRFPEVIRWLSRSFRAGQHPMIKASSFVSVLAEQLLSQGNKALFLYAPLARYLPTILAGPASIQETNALAGARLQRLAKNLGCSPANMWELSLAQKVAMSWLCELTTLYIVQRSLGSDNILWMDFEMFLDRPAEELLRAADHFGTPLTIDRAEKLTSGPIMTSYSKAPEHDYSPDLRRELLAEASQNHANDIRAAMLWVNDLAKRHPLIADAINWIETEK